jgi:hypothetical protein
MFTTNKWLFKDSLISYFLPFTNRKQTLRALWKSRLFVIKVSNCSSFHFVLKGDDLWIDDLLLPQITTAAQGLQHDWIATNRKCWIWEDLSTEHDSSSNQQVDDLEVVHLSIQILPILLDYMLLGAVMLQKNGSFQDNDPH